MNSERDLWYGTSGPPDAPIVLVGESWGIEELQARRPFVGSSGVELNRMLAEAGVSRDSILCTNVAAEKPTNNETWRLFLPRDSKPERINGIAPSPLVRSEVTRLYNQITYAPRRIVIATGNWALWALSQRTGASILSESNNRAIPTALQTWAPNGIMSWRGSMWYCEPHTEFTIHKDQADALSKTPLLPIIHPAAIMRAWANRAPTVHDLRARVPMALRGDWRPNPEPIFWAPPSFDQCIGRLQMWLRTADARVSGREPALRLAVDIETARSFITCLGIADSVNFAMSIPFIRKHDDGGFESWWTPEQEAEIVHNLRRLFLHPGVLIEGQNFIYDTQYIQHWLGCTPPLDFDTMLAQNVIFPGTPKSLDYLSSLFCTYHWYWKEDHKEWDLSGTVEQLLRYNCLDCIRTWEIAARQREVIAHLGQTEQMSFKMRTNALCLRMMNRGVRVDTKHRARLAFELEEHLNRIYTELLEIVPQDLVKPHRKKDDKFWYRSDTQTKTLFYDVLGMRKVLHRKTGRPTSGKEALSQLKRWYPEFTGLFDRLDTAGSVDNTIGVCRAATDPDERWRCSYNPGGTETHRLSSSKNAFGRGTNLQNLSKGEEDD